MTRDQLQTAVEAAKSLRHVPGIASVYGNEVHMTAQEFETLIPQFGPATITERDYCREEYPGKASIVVDGVRVFCLLDPARYARMAPQPVEAAVAAAANGGAAS